MLIGHILNIFTHIIYTHIVMKAVDVFSFMFGNLVINY